MRSLRVLPGLCCVQRVRGQHGPQRGPRQPSAAGNVAN